MNATSAKEALHWMENDTGIMSCNDDAWPIAIRALRLLAAAEANDGEAAYVISRLRDVKCAPLHDDAIELIESLAARVGELEKDAARVEK